MERQSAQWWYVILGLGLWAGGQWGASTFDIVSWPFRIAGLMATTGTVVFLMVVAIGVWRSLERP